MLTADVIEMIRTAATAAREKKAFDLVALDVSELSSFADGFLVCSAANDRQVHAISDEVGRRLRDTGRRPLHVEGAARSEWMLLDYGDLVVHVFTEEKRAYYQLDSLWIDAPRLEGEVGPSAVDDRA
jgi:ribosome-associated protein